MGSRKGRFGRSRAAAAAAAADGSNADEDAQQEVTVLMMQQLPALLTTYQAEPMVVSAGGCTACIICEHRGSGLWREGMLAVGLLVCVG